MGARRASLPTGSDRANRRFAETTVPGHFAQTGPVRVDLAWARPVPLHFAPAGPLRGDVARVGSLPAHFARAGRVGAFVWAVLGHLVRAVRTRPVPAHLVRAVRARPVLAHLPRPPKLGIASTGLQLA